MTEIKSYNLMPGTEIESKQFRFFIGDGPRNCKVEMRNAAGEFEPLKRVQSLKIEYDAHDASARRITLAFHTDIPPTNAQTN